jgi:Protein of unknown function DUF262
VAATVINARDPILPQRIVVRATYRKIEFTGPEDVMEAMSTGSRHGASAVTTPRAFEVLGPSLNKTLNRYPQVFRPTESIEVTTISNIDLLDVPQELDSRGKATGVEAEDNDVLLGIHNPFDPERIDVVTRNPTVDLLLSRIRNSRVDLQPDFQRHAGIWTPRAKSRLIESLLLRIPLPTFYAAEGDDDTWAMVDGIQRLTTIAEFVEPQTVGSTPMRLRDLEYLGEQCNGSRFVDLPGRLQTRLRETELVVHLIRRGTPDEVKFNIFARINTGGLPLTSQELRHALIPGQARGILKEWAESVPFLNATAHGVRSDRMSDREMILRFAAFRLTNPEEYSHDDLDRFLRDAMNRLNDLDSESVRILRDEFETAMESAHRIFGDFAFRKRDPNGGERRYPINKALFEAVSVNLAANPSNDEQLALNQDRVNEQFRLLMSNPTFQGAVSQGTGAIRKVQCRFGMIRDLFASVTA